MTISPATLPTNLGRESLVAVPTAAQVPRQAERVRDAVAFVQDKKAADVTPTQAAAAMEEVNQSLQLASIGVRFEFDKEARMMVTKVMDVETGEMIRQMPNEEVIRISKMIGQLQGLLVSEKA